MDGQFVSSVHRVRDLLDLVDAKWLSDRLSDDDIDIPAGVDVSSTGTDGTYEIPEPDANADKRWADLGLHEFAESSGISPAK
ncbi:Anaphase-promoting complex subunit 13 [Plasmodiophora brassicae]|uniref:Anaphase-promoting complex subunit 13 n=1 Tax=Plasmodiophora brassicae TaxID=37360 RepID=A0A0G4ISX2_PLABS|nr:hypothetical protein PBRA_006479 [Plasmodiophora brassicae]SPQ94450.1 unnamed protein product [Plasmodiophora brassicae]